ncbi:MAG TPA: hypothetical protein VNK43_09475, partial [Gemmatimonadales bacterium]|nr:hypothetical protein [Gemmatimonadales bacterium]
MNDAPEAAGRAAAAPRSLAWSVLLEPAPLPGWRNMAVDQALLDLADREGRAFLRLYRWEPSCVSFGRHEPV